MKVTKLAVAMVAALGIAGAVSAATVSWSSASLTTSGGFGETLDAGQFDTSGTEVLAENIGGGALTFDGINFAAGTTSWAGDFDGFHEGGGAQNTDLLRFGTYGDDAANTFNTVSLTGLTSGHSYRIQAVVYDGRGDSFFVGRTVEFDGMNQGQYANGVSGVTWGSGLLVTGAFTADATTQDFTIEAFDTTSDSEGGQLNALLVHQTAIPEPATLGMIAAFGGAILFIRRKLMV